MATVNKNIKLTTLINGDNMLDLLKQLSGNIKSSVLSEKATSTIEMPTESASPITTTSIIPNEKETGNPTIIPTKITTSRTTSTPTIKPNESINNNIMPSSNIINNLTNSNSNSKTNTFTLTTTKTIKITTTPAPVVTNNQNNITTTTKTSIKKSTTVVSNTTVISNNLVTNNLNTVGPSTTTVKPVESKPTSESSKPSSSSSTNKQSTTVTSNSTNGISDLLSKPSDNFIENNVKDPDSFTSNTLNENTYIYGKNNTNITTGLGDQQSNSRSRGTGVVVLIVVPVIIIAVMGIFILVKKFNHNRKTRSSIYHKNPHPQKMIRKSNLFGTLQFWNANKSNHISLSTNSSNTNLTSQNNLSISNDRESNIPEFSEWLEAGNGNGNNTTMSINTNTSAATISPPPALMTDDRVNGLTSSNFAMGTVNSNGNGHTSSDMNNPNGINRNQTAKFAWKLEGMRIGRDSQRKSQRQSIFNSFQVW